MSKRISNLFLAVQHGDIKEIINLIKKGEDVNSRGLRGNTVLHYAAEFNKNTVIEFRAAHSEEYFDSNNSFQGDRYYREEVMFNNHIYDDLAKYGNTKIMEVLLEAGASIDSRNDYDETPLHYAARSHSGKNIKFLVEAGADVNAKNKRGDIPNIPKKFKTYKDRLNNEKQDIAEKKIQR